MELLVSVIIDTGLSVRAVAVAQKCSHSAMVGSTPPFP